jgi:hypothetical protein
MKLITLITGAAIASSAIAYPGMKNIAHEIRHLAKKDLNDGTVPMIGDLATKGNTTAVGTLIKNCLEGQVDCYLPNNNVSSLTSKFCLLLY